MPSLSTRAFAEMLSLSAYQQSRILLEQKYPQQAPQVFKIPFYTEALNAIKSFYSNNNDSDILLKTIDDINSSSKLQAKKNNNIRVINAFLKSKQVKRKLSLLPNKRYNVTIDDVNIRLNFDLTAYDNKTIKYIFYNFRNAPLDEESARLGIEISYFVLKSNGISTDMKDLEYVDLFNNKTYTFSKPRKTTSMKVRQNINIIEALWNTV